MKITKSKLKEMIREEIQKLNEKKMNPADRYGLDSVRIIIKTIEKNKNKKPKEILKMLRNDKKFSVIGKYFDDEVILPDIELLTRNIKNRFSYKNKIYREY